MDISLAAALIALAILVLDPLLARWNYRRYKSDNRTESKNKFQTAMRRREMYKNVALILMVVSSLMTIYSSKEDKKMADDQIQKLIASLNSLDSASKDSEQRIKRIEQFLWGKGGPDSSGEDRDPNGPKRGPSPEGKSISERFAEIEDSLAAMKRANAELKRDIEIIEEEIITAKEQINNLDGMPAG